MKPKHPDAEFVRLQLNYADQKNPEKSKKGLYKIRNSLVKNHIAFVHEDVRRERNNRKANELD